MPIKARKVVQRGVTQLRPTAYEALATLMKDGSYYTVVKLEQKLLELEYTPSISSTMTALRRHGGVCVRSTTGKYTAQPVLNEVSGELARIRKLMYAYTYNRRGLVSYAQQNFRKLTRGWRAEHVTELKAELAFYDKLVAAIVRFEAKYKLRERVTRAKSA